MSPLYDAANDSSQAKNLWFWPAQLLFDSPDLQAHLNMSNVTLCTWALKSINTVGNNSHFQKVMVVGYMVHIKLFNLYFSEELHHL